MARIKMSLDEWLSMFDIIYKDKNDVKSAEAIALHIAEIYLNFGRCFKPPIDEHAIKELIPKCFAWICALANKCGINSLEELLWMKYPGYCPFCENSPCNCPPRPEKPITLVKVYHYAKENLSKRPHTLTEWLELFARIYGAKNKNLELLPLALKLSEEIGELLEAVRIREYDPDSFKNELADVLAWFFATINRLNDTIFKKNAIDLESLCWSAYPNACDTCKRNPCVCPESYISRRVAEPGPYMSDVYDPFLKIYNKNKLIQDIEAKINEKKQIFILIIDIDNFKSINDTYGHIVGDMVLRQITKIIKEETVDKAKGELYRYGGEELIVLIEDSSKEEVKNIAELIRERIKNTHNYYGQSISVTVSIGIAQSEEGVNTEELIMWADKAMYEAKRSGKDKVCFYGEQ